MKPYPYLLPIPVLFIMLFGCIASARASEWESLFNGKDLAGWSIAVEGAPVGTDPKGHIVVKDGVIHMYANAKEETRGDFGVIVSDRRFSRYHLSLEYAWGGRRFEPRKDKLLDAGLLYHITDPNARTWGIWPVSIECQIQEGDTGDLVFLKTSALTWLHPRPSEAPEGQGTAGLLPELGGTPKRCNQRDTSYVGRFPVADSVDGWNKVDVIVQGSEYAIHLVNDRIRSRMMSLGDDKDQPLSEGHIALQLEAAEVKYRNIKIRTLPAALVPSQHTLKFSGAAEGGAGVLSIRVKNPGQAELPLSLSVIGKDTQCFTAEYGEPAPSVLAPGAEITVNVRFHPPASGDGAPRVAGLQIGTLETGTLVVLDAPAGAGT